MVTNAGWIDGAQGLVELAATCAASACVGLDTEFVWERTYYPRLGIVQVSLDDGSCHLVDVPGIGSLHPLRVVLEDARIVKVLHDAPQDLTILRRETGGFAMNVFDTRVAAGFCGYRASLSLQDLLRAALDVSLPKSETRTDWLQRPLSSRQHAYAVDDVRHLIPLRSALIRKAADAGREAWLEEELRTLDDPCLYEERDPDVQFSRVRGSGRLSPVETAVLKELAAWRERTARELDLPRGHVVTDEILVQTAKRRPARVDDLRSLRGLSVPSRERFGEGLVGAVRDGMSRPAIHDDDGRQPTPREDVRSDFAMAYVRGKALDQGIDPALVSSRNDVRALVERRRDGGPEKSRLLSGWRRAFVGEDLLQILEGKKAVKLAGRGRLPRMVES